MLGDFAITGFWMDEWGLGIESFDPRRLHTRYGKTLVSD